LTLRAIVLALVLALVLAAGASRPALAQSEFDASARELDGQVFLEDVPIWVCSTMRGIERARWRLVGRTPDGRTMRFEPEASADSSARLRAVELATIVRGRMLPPDHLRLVAPEPPIGFPVGNYELRPARGDTARVLARFSIVPARGAEASVRAGASRARRLLDQGRIEDACRLYEGIMARYPRTAYREAIYLGLWETRAYDKYGAEPDLWLEEIFAHFHDTCFGVFAIDRIIATRGRADALTILRQMAGIYTDTRMARAAAAWF
jgi:hypothetical protein